MKSEAAARVRCGVWMRSRRARAGLTLKQVALGTGVTRQAVAQWESGERMPSLPRFVLWARSIGSSPAEAIGQVEVVIE